MATVVILDRSSGFTLPPVCPNCLSPLEAARTQGSWPHCAACDATRIRFESDLRKKAWRETLWITGALLLVAPAYTIFEPDYVHLPFSLLSIGLALVESFRMRAWASRYPRVRGAVTLGEAARILSSRADPLRVRFENPEYARRFAELNPARKP